MPNKLTRAPSNPGSRTLWRGALTIGVLGLLAGCSGGAAPILTCEPAGGITPDCRFQNPEDLVASPAGGFILVSQFGDLEGRRAGSLVAYDPDTGAIAPLFPAAEALAPHAAEPAADAASQAGGWGEADCAPPPTELFSPHGIDIQRLDDGTHALYVINHGGRESIEMFEVVERDARVRLIWRGCVIAPAHGYFNDLVVLGNGDFWVSQMFPRHANVIWAALRMQFSGYSPGYAYHWSPAAGFTRMAGTDVKLANGVEKSADERYLYLNSYLGNELVKIDTRSGTRMGSASVSGPDNLAWSPTGELLVASHHASIADTLACQDIEAGNCGFRFQVIAIDPDTLATRVLLDHEGPPIGAATVALPFGDQVYLGTFAGDRIARFSAALLEPSP